MQEKISIIVPIYNVEPYLKRCVDSLVKQKYKNIEILLIDDCSTDGSAAIAKKYEKEYSKICRFIQREKNGGLSAARNTGIEASTGEWIVFVDSDDWVTSDYVSALYEVALEDKSDIVMSSIYYYYSNGNCREISPFADLTTESGQKEKVALCRPYAVTRLFRKKFLLDAGLEFPTNVWRAAEQGLIIPLLTRTSKISILNKPMYYYYQRMDSNSNKNHKNVDISFYPKSCKNVENNSMPGYEQELEYRAISDLMYGLIMIMIRSGKGKSEICREIDCFKKNYPDWDKNIYLSKMEKGKRIFIEFAKKKKIIILKILIWGWDIKQKILRI